MVEQVPLNLFRGPIHAIQKLMATKRAGRELFAPFGPVVDGHFICFALPRLLPVKRFIYIDAHMLLIQIYLSENASVGSCRHVVGELARYSHFSALGWVRELAVATFLRCLFPTVIDQ